jgi:rhodanese-related sulfurtransferase
MLNGRFAKPLAVTLSMVVLGIFAAATIASEVTRISTEELKAMLGNPDVVILDVDRKGNWKDRDRKILGAVRQNPKEIQSWMNTYPKDKTLVLY